MRRPSLFAQLTTWQLLALVLGAACSDPSTSPPPLPSAAKGAPSGDIVVTAAEPSEAPQDTTLDIKVSGSNFTRSSSVALGLGGTPSAKITTNSTRYVNGSQLIANVTISADAAVALYDVMVFDGIRKPGIGTEMFAVRTTGQVINPTATFTYFAVSPATDAGGIFGDGRTATGAPGTVAASVYDDGRCNVTATIFENISGDATMDPIGAGGRVRDCDSRSARSVTVRFGRPLYLAPGVAAAGDVTGGHYTNVREVLALTVKGSTGDRRFRLMLRGSSACDILRYEARTLGGYSGMPITVTRVSSRADGDAEDAWEAVPQAVDGKYLAFCEKGGTADNPVLIAVYDVNFRIRVVRK
jgi:hypothetical protein